LFVGFLVCRWLMLVLGGFEGRGGLGDGFLTAWWFPWRAGGWKDGGEDGAGAEHLRSGNGAGDARVLLLLRRDRARRHQIVSACRLLWLLLRLLLSRFPFIIAQPTCIVILSSDSWLAVMGWRWGGRLTSPSRTPRPSRLRCCYRYVLLR
jgi:hypothetical protein